MKAIETVYKGYRFRSRLEARWAVFFDAIGMKYEYEPEGFELSDGTKYLPDFYLPESKDYFEVKGVMTETDKHKILQFIEESKKPVTVGYSDFTFRACYEFPADDDYSSYEYALDDPSESVLVRCPKCGKHYFIGETGGWGCRCCKAYDGDKYHVPVLWGNNYWDPEPHISDALIKAKQARFEHGEKP